MWKILNGQIAGVQPSLNKERYPGGFFEDCKTCRQAISFRSSRDNTFFTSAIDTRALLLSV
jgi:hypothetical protein